MASNPLTTVGVKQFRLYLEMNDGTSMVVRSEGKVVTASLGFDILYEEPLGIILCEPKIEGYNLSFSARLKANEDGTVYIVERTEETVDEG